MTMEDEPKFICEKYHLTMQADKQPGFCAKRFAKALDGDFCLECEHGKKAANNRRGTGGWKSFQNENQKEAVMAEKKLCSEGCGKGAVKDDLCTRHYRKKHGTAPFPSFEHKGKKTAKHRQGKASKSTSSGKKGRVNGKAGAINMCEGCEQVMVEKVMIAAGIVPAEKFEQARKIMRDLGA